MHPTASLNGHASQNHPLPVGDRFTQPSTNGSNGAAAEKSPSPNGANGHDARGRFAKGNRGGPGNPFARRVARFRTLLLEIVSEDDLCAVLHKLVERARAGNLVATRLLLNYLVGRPVDTVDPDRLDLDEWRLFQESATDREVAENAAKIGPGLAAIFARLLQEMKQDMLLGALHEARQAART